ncbi:MAG: hypothetical protein K8R73_05095 [Clostridiales bacterium]|nr:hypothetical protein [Clostridiales bacterium]
MAETFLMLLALGYALVIMIIVVPMKIKKVDEKMDLLKFQIQQLDAKMDKLIIMRNSADE